MMLLASMIPVGIITIIVGIVLIVIGAVHKESEKKFKPAEVMLAIVHFLALTTVALAIVQIGFAVAEKWIPDALLQNNYGYGYDSPVENARYALAVLVITAPLYLLLFWKGSKVALSWAKKFMAGASVLTSGIVAFVTLIMLVHSFIAGGVGLQFFAKTIMILLVSGGIAAYYQLYLRKDPKEFKKITLLYFLKVSGLSVIAVIAGFCVIGSPLSARAERFDDRRLNDLSNMQWQIQSYFEENEKMPAKLLDLHDATRGYALPADPRTQKAYEYRIIKESFETKPDGARRGVAEFELCATFETERLTPSGATAYDASQTMRYSKMSAESFLPSYYSGDMSPHWNHKKGKQCFNRTIKRSENIPVPYETMRVEPAILE